MSGAMAGQGVFVTGGASGLGRATVLACHAAGAEVTFLDLPRSDGAALAEELGPRARFVPGDVTRDEDVLQAVALAAGAAPLRLAVGAAGVGPPSKLFDEDGPRPAGRVRPTLEVSVTGSYNLLAAAGQAMAGIAPDDAGERGVIVLTSSIAAYDGQVGQVAYAAAKAAVAGMVLPAARELARHLVRVGAIAPGLFDTPLLASMPQKARDSAAAQVPHPSRLGRPGEFAQMVQAVRANRMLNGEVIRLDGALRMAPR